MQVEDFINKTFGKLTVLEFDHRDNYSHDCFKCKCSCGNPLLKIVAGYNLTAKLRPTVSCNRCIEFELLGKRFGKLVVNTFHHRDSGGNAWFECSCSCGNDHAIIRGNKLTRKRKYQKSCGRCQEFELIGKTFGKLTVLSFVGRDKWQTALFECSCSCGRFSSRVRGSSLKAGRTTQCQACALESTTRTGKNENHLLDLQEKQLHINIVRQLIIAPYVVDGYCRDTNTVFEVYEKCHDKRVFEDLIREETICKKLGCDFVIIHDRSH